MSTGKVSKEIALKELTSFLKQHKTKEFRRGILTAEKIEEDYIDVLESIEDGYLTFDKDGKPVYKLVEPLHQNSEDQSLVVKEVKLRRVRAADKALVMNGLDFEKERGTYIIKLVSYITQLSIADVKLLGNEDYTVLNQLCSVF